MDTNVIALNQALVDEAKKWVGVKESGGRYRGPEIEMFQKSVSPADVGFPWCACFVHYCVQKVADQNSIMPKLVKSAGVLDMWNRTPKELRLTDPKPGCVVVWQHGHTAEGHTGIVTEVEERIFHTVEGDTSDSSGIDRLGNGCYEKIRHRHPQGSMRLLGYLDPFMGATPITQDRPAIA